MKKIFLKFNRDLLAYIIFENAQTANFSLQNLYHALRHKICMKNLKSMSFENWETIRYGDKVLILDSDNMKPMADIDFKTKQEMEDWYKSYREYSKKRWDDMPKLWMSWDNYQEIISKWDKVREQKPPYIIFSQDDQGYVDLVGKQELSQQDLADMKIEHEKYLKYRKAWQKYERAHPNRSEVWSSPEDSEFEADWQKYLED